MLKLETLSTLVNAISCNSRRFQKMVKDPLKNILRKYLNIKIKIENFWILIILKMSWLSSSSLLVLKNNYRKRINFKNHTKIKYVSIWNPGSFNKFSVGLQAKLQQNYFLQNLDVLHGRLLGSHVNFHWQLGGHNNHQSCSSNDISHCSSSQVCTKIAEGCRWELKARNSAVQLCAYLT